MLYTIFQSQLCYANKGRKGSSLNSNVWEYQVSGQGTGVGDSSYMSHFKSPPPHKHIKDKGFQNYVPFTEIDLHFTR